jgi:hypothetical protein
MIIERNENQSSSKLPKASNYSLSALPTSVVVAENVAGSTPRWLISFSLGDWHANVLAVGGASKILA